MKNNLDSPASHARDRFKVLQAGIQQTPSLPLLRQVLQKTRLSDPIGFGQDIPGQVPN